MASSEESILCHICVETHQNIFPSGRTRGGYRQDLLENILTPLERSLIVCCSCEGVMRDPQLTEEGYKCRSCLEGREGRPATVNKTEIDKLRVVCPFKQEGCSWSSTIGLLVSHVEECDLCLVSCPLCCGESMKRAYLKKHENEECSERNTNCEFCLINIKVSQTSDHLKTCPNFPLECLNGCNSGRIPRKDMSLHVSELCPLTMIPCPYNKYGCSISSKRKDIESHEMEFVAKHVRIMNTHKELMDTGMQLLKAQVYTLTSHIENIGTALQHNRGLEWEIQGVRERFDDKTRLYSDPFYVDNYKFQGWAEFNSEDNNALGIYVRLCVGVLDGSLKWPFFGRVTLTLINMRNSNKLVTESFLTKDIECFTKRTGDSYNNGYGYSSFATKAAVLTKFSEANKIIITIEIESRGKSDRFVKQSTS